MLKSLSTSLILRGILALAVGVTALAWPGITVLALVVLFAVYAFMASGLEAVRAFSSRTAGPVFGHLLVGLIDLAAGVLALAWPGPTALVLVLIVASWAVIAGVTEVAAAVRGRESAGTQALFTLGGLISVAFGAVLFAHPAVGAVTLALLFGLFNLVYGARTLVQGIELRRIRNVLHSAVPAFKPQPRPASSTAPLRERMLAGAMRRWLPPLPPCQPYAPWRFPRTGGRPRGSDAVEPGRISSVALHQ
jgi:uncharacterized membrane protein HdeD (DUF308 family)